MAPEKKPDPKKPVLIAEKSASAHSWSPVQAIETFLADVKAGKIHPAQIVIVWTDSRSDGSKQIHRWKAQVDRTEEIAFLDVARLQAIEEWRS